MAARTARKVLQSGTRSFTIFRRISGPQTMQNAVKSLHRISTFGLQVHPTLSNVLCSQSLGKFRRIQDLPVSNDARSSILSANDGNFQDTLLEQMSSEDDDDQFRTKDTISKVKDAIEIAQLYANIFAVIYIGGSQFKVTENDIIMVNKLNAELGSRIRLEKVLLVGGENFTMVGRPLVSKNVVEIQATLIENTKTKKVIVFKKKRRKGYKRTQGHRQGISALRINRIILNSESL